VAVMGIFQLTRGKMSTALKEPLFVGSSPNPSSYALALFSGLWAYDGWDQGMISLATPLFSLPTLPSANFVVGEMRDADKNLPRVIHWSMGITTVRFSLPLEFQRH
jgi:amino acid transporter